MMELLNVKPFRRTDRQSLLCVEYELGRQKKTIHAIGRSILIVVVEVVVMLCLLFFMLCLLIVADATSPLHLNAVALQTNESYEQTNKNDG